MKLTSLTLLVLVLQSQSVFSNLFSEDEREFAVVEEKMYDSSSCSFHVGERIRSLHVDDVEQGVPEDGGAHDHDRTLGTALASSHQRHRRAVRLNLPLQPSECDTISVDIPHDRVKMYFKKMKSSSNADRASGVGGSSSNFARWSGMEPTNGSFFNFVQDDDGHMSGSLVDVKNHDVLQFHSTHDGEYAVTITPSSDFPPEDDPNFPDEEEPIADDGKRRLRVTNNKDSIFSLRNNSQPTNQGSTSSILSSLKSNLSEQARRKLPDDSGANLDVMVVWTKKAECANSGLPTGCAVDVTTEANMRALIDLAMFETNEAYLNSGIATELLLAHAYRHPSYVETSFSQSLTDVRTGNGVLSDVPNNRATHGADLVALLISDSQYCGLAYVGPSKDYMYSVTGYNCATGYYSFGHEIGHNLGCLHDRGASNACSNTNYNYGWRDPSANFRTVLAYSCSSGQCDNNAGGGCSRVPYYSTPNVLYNGQAVGNASNDNARQINDVRATVAAYFPHAGGTTPSPVVTTPAPVASPVAITPAPVGPPTNAFCGNGVCEVSEGEGCGSCPSDCFFSTHCNVVGNSGGAVYGSATFGIVFDATVGATSLYFYELQVWLMNASANAKVYMKSGPYTSDSNVLNWTKVFDGSLTRGASSRANIEFQSRFYAAAGSTVAFYISYEVGGAFVYSNNGASFANADVTVQSGNAVREQTGNTLPSTVFAGRDFLDDIKYDYGTSTTLAPVASTSAPSLSPVSAPSSSPVKSPTAVPTKAPTSSPMKSPTSSPTAAPVTPTQAPVASPTSSCSCCEELESQMDNMEAMIEEILNALQSPTVTSSPVAPTAAPAAPTIAPVASPITNCVDKTGSWKIKNKTRAWCVWVKSGNTSNKCRNWDLYNDCPSSCKSECA